MLLHTAHLTDDIELLLGHRLNRESLTSLHNSHLAQFCVVFEVLEVDEGFEGHLLLDVEGEPSGVFLGGFGIVIFVFCIELGGVRVACPDNFYHSGNAGFFAVGVVEEGEIPFFSIDSTAINATGTKGCEVLECGSVTSAL